MVPTPETHRIDFDAGSFRDRNGRVFYHEGEVYRGLSSSAAAFWDRLAASEFLSSAMRNGTIVATESVEDARRQTILPSGEWPHVLKHARIPVISYPYEWCFGMLKDAALLQLDLVMGAAAEGFETRDATPYNVQWVGSRPVFIDVASFGILDRPGPWVAYRQFCRMFLNPLFLQAYRDVPFQPWLRGSLDGIGTGELRNLFGFADLWRRGVASHVLLHAAFEGAVTAPADRVKTEMLEAGYHKELLLSVVSGLRKVVRSLEWKKTKTKWSDYAQEHSYHDEDFKQKEEFVRRACQAAAGKIVWDVGANTGHFSRIAGENAAHVVALESDHLAVERHYQTLKASGDSKILPLFYDFANPSPALGWKNQERRTLPERARPTLVLCLAVVHHLVISHNILLEDLIGHLASVTRHLVIEFVGREDPMTISLLRSKEGSFDDYTQANFEALMERFFQVEQRCSLPSGHRFLYAAQSRGE
jgi:hypothetical protein